MFRRIFLLAFIIAALAAASFAQAKKTITYLELTRIGNGTVAATTVVAEEQMGILHKTILTLTDVSVSVSDTNVGGGTKLYDFPEGRILVLGGVAKSITPTTTSTLASTLNASKTLSVGLGTVQTTTQASGTLATTEQDIISAFTATSSATISVAGTAGNGADDGTPQGFDGTTTAKDLYLNIGVPTATDIDGDATVTVSGTVIIYWILVADY